MVCHSRNSFPSRKNLDEPQVVINQDDLIEMGSQGVSMKLVHNGNPNRTLAMILKRTSRAQPLGKELSIRVRK